MDALSVRDQKPDHSDLATRVFEHRAFELGWIVFIAAFETFVTFPVQRILLVWWVYGINAFYQNGIRVIPRKPLRFSNGVLVPQGLQIITGFGLFFATFFGLSLTLFYGLRIFDHWHLRRPSSDRD
jgi:hypothetical protein